MGFFGNFKEEFPVTGYDDSNILTVLDIIGDLYFELDLSGRITFVNDSVHLITGFSRSQDP